MLPQPRNGVKSTKSLIPHVLTKKPAAPAKGPLHTPAKKSKGTPTALITEYSDDSDNDEVENDFFSIHKPVEKLEDVELPLDVNLAQNIKTEAKDKHRSIESYFKKEEVMDHVKLEPDHDDQGLEEQTESSSGYIGFGAESSSNIDLDDEAVSNI